MTDRPASSSPTFKASNKAREESLAPDPETLKLNDELMELRSRHKADEALARIDEIHKEFAKIGKPTIFFPLQIKLLQETGQFSAAIDFLEEAERVNPDNVIGLRPALIETLPYTGRTDAARELLERTISEHSSSPHPLPGVFASLLLSFDYWDTLKKLIAEGRIRLGENKARRIDLAIRAKDVLDRAGDPPKEELDAWKKIFKDLGESDGYRHNYEFPDGSKLFDFASIKMNSPLWEKNFNFIEWREIKALTSNIDFTDLRVLDIGAADGYFSVQAALAGAASVDSIEPEGLFCLRARTFARFHGVSDRVTQRSCLFERSYQKHYGRYDIVIALGLIYHLNDMYLGLSNLCELSDRIVIETMISDVDWQDDYPAIRFKESDPVDMNWVKRFFAERGYRYRESAVWAKYVDRHERSRGRRLFYFERTG